MAGADKIDVAYVAHLARLHLDPRELQTFQSQLEQIVRYVGKIEELSLQGVEPTSHAVSLRNVFRSDAARPGLSADIPMRNAPASSNGQFIVPKIVE